MDIDDIYDGIKIAKEIEELTTAMRIVAVDDELIALKNIEMKLKEYDAETELFTFRSASKALAWVEENAENAETEPDLALLDIHLGKMNGIALAKKLREVCPNCDIIFLTGYSEYAVQSYDVRASGYWLKPVSQEQLTRDLDFVKAKHPKVYHPTKKFRVQCFGNFEVFIDNRMVSFTRKKSKELFAYLIDRKGSSATMAEIASILWADGIYDRSRNNQIHTYLHDLSKTLKKESGIDIILRKRNALAVDISQIDCDYLRFLEGDLEAIHAYTGEYMSQYWWAEFTTGSLTAQMFE